MLRHNGSTTGFYRLDLDGKYTTVTQPNGNFVCQIIFALGRVIYQVVRLIRA